MIGNRPSFWKDDDGRLYDEATWKAWDHRDILPFEIETKDEGRDVKWRVIAYVKLNGQNLNTLDALGFAGPYDVMKTIPHSGLAHLKKHHLSEYQSFGLGFLYRRLKELGKSAKELQELIAPFIIGKFDDITDFGNVNRGEWIQCVSCTAKRYDYTILVDESNDPPSYYCCSGCGSSKGTYWFGPMGVDWQREHGKDWHIAHNARVDMVRKLLKTSPAEAGASTDETTRKDMKLAEVFKLKTHHVHMLMAHFTPAEVTKRGAIEEGE